MILLERLHVVLSQNKVSRTKARDEVFLALKRHGPCSSVDVVRLLQGRVARRTVYDALNLFVEIGIASRINGLLEVSAPLLTYHHHHFVCIKCGVRMDFGDDKLEARLERFAASRRVIITGHQVELTGLCGRCKVHYQV